MQTKKFKATKNFSGMKTKLFLSFGGLLLLSILMVLLANRGSFKALNAYHNFSNYYQELSDFYRNIESAESSAKAYLYDRSEENLIGYKQSILESRNRLNSLIDHTQNKKSKWEYIKLVNMVTTYDSLFTDIINNTIILNDSYGFFSRLPSNIQATYITFNEMITNDMKSEYHTIYSNLRRQLTMIIIIICLMIAMSVTGTWLAIHSITRPISKLVHNIQKIKQKDYQIHTVKSADMEIQLLSNAIVDMAESIQENISYVEERITLEKILLQQENENLKMNELLIATQLKVLQDQMNPHFLFNTLNLITKMAYLEKAQKTRVLMEKTADLLRYSLDKSNSSSDLSGEVACIKNYIKIQEARFGQRIHFSLTMPDTIPNVVMPGMILQPLVENAVSHGVKDMMDHACVQLSILRKADKIHVVIEDNGKGMESELIERLLEDNEHIRLDSQSKRTGIGIRNVIMRLKMFYGEDGIVNIESSKNCGTVMTVIIPITEEDHYV